MTSQTFNKEDIEKLLQHKQKLEQIVYHSDVNRETIENEVSQKEIQIEEVYGKLEQTMYEYNVLIHKLKLVPLESKRAKNINYVVTIDREADSIENICTTDHKVNYDVMKIGRNLCIVEIGCHTERIVRDKE